VGWCAKDTATLKDNMEKIKLTFSLNGQAVDIGKFLQLDYPNAGQQCRAFVLGLTDWKGGEHHIVTTANFTVLLNDGSQDYPAGKQVFDYTIYVNP
jgi:hypothetical protein